MRKDRASGGGQGAWIRAVHSRPEVARIDEVYDDLLALREALPEDAFLREHFATIVGRLYKLALQPYYDTTPIPGES
jgi:hypothetical protein